MRIHRPDSFLKRMIGPLVLAAAGGCLALISLFLDGYGGVAREAAELHSAVGKAPAYAESVYRGCPVGSLNAAVFQANANLHAPEVPEEEPREIPVVSGNAELDAYLDLILEYVVGRDEGSLRRAYEWIGSYEHFSYMDMDYVSRDDPWEEWSVPYAIQMIGMEGGNCYRYAGLMCWIARALGYDARAVAGEVLVSSGWVWHGWVEVDVDGQTRIIDAQQHARPIHEGLDFFMVTYEEAPLYYTTEW